MTPERFRQISQIYHATLEREPEERADFLHQSCGRDRDLRHEVESLLASEKSAEAFFSSKGEKDAAKILDNPSASLVGRTLDNYHLISLLGVGGMGEVYLARDTKLGREVAIKVLPAGFASSNDRLRFEREARAASALNHPNILTIYEIREADEQLFIVAEFVDGETLRRRMKKGRLKLGEVLDVAIQVANALSAAHAAGIVHRDIKPENVMLRRDALVKVLDFGLAKLADTQTTSTGPEEVTLQWLNTEPGLVLGTHAYMSPEQARGLPVDARTDIWSLGVVLYEMVSGRPPFVGETPTDVVVAIVEKEPPAISKFLAAVPPELERIVRKALRKDPNERYQIAKEMAIDLRSLRKDLEGDSQLDRSVAPSATGGSATASGAESVAVATGRDQAINTDQLQASRLTTVGLPSVRRSPWARRLALAALLLILIAGVLAIYKFINRSETARVRFQRINVTKLTTNGNALFASISPDGKYVAYVKSENGKESLWLRQVGSAGNLEVAPPREGHYLGVAFSPDGSSIYYGYATTGVNDEAEIYRVPVLGTGAPPVRVNPEEGPSSLSHDGKRIAFLRHSRANQADTLIVAKADGSQEQTLATRKWPDRFVWDWASAPAWTNDDQKLDLTLVNSDANGFYITIYELSLPDRAEKIIPLSAQRFEQPNHVSLLSDATAVILSGRVQGASFQQIWYLGRDGSARPLTSDLSDYRAVILTADSTSLVTTQTQTLGNISVAPKGETAHITQITSGVGRYFDLSWAPDGKIVYASDASGSADIYEIGANGANVRQLTSNMKRNYAPAVSPDNRFIVLHSNRSGVFQIWRIDRDGSNPVQLTFGNSESHWPQFSADGKSVIYEHFEAGVSAIMWQVPIEGGIPTKVIEGFAVRPAVSPDGKWLAFWQNDGQPNTPWRLGLFSFESAKHVRTFDVAPTVQVGWDTLLRWSADSRNLTFVDNRGGFENVWAQPIDGGPARQLTDFRDRDIFSFDWSQDGNLVTSKGVITSDVVLISDAGQ